MSQKQAILARLSGEGKGTLFLPDLTLWYRWHSARGTLPPRWQGLSQAEVASTLGVPGWLVVRPWRVETPGITIEESQQGEERLVRTVTPYGTLVARWTLGPDGDWWQTEYPVKRADHLAAARALADAKTYVLDDSDLTRAQAQLGERGVVAAEIPKRAYSDILHDLLGWGEGLLLLREQQDVIAELVAILEAKAQDLIRQLAGLPASVYWAPENLDSQFISAQAFEEHMAESYRTATRLLHEHGKWLIVHAGGPVRRLLEQLSRSGVDGVEGIAGPPQSDCTLAEARAVAGPDFTLWGGIPQDFLLATHSEEAFRTAVRQAAQEAAMDRRTILGVVDRVPVDAEIGRLESIPALVEQALSA
jgi:hypothetical protein